MIVVDASVLVNALTDDGLVGDLSRAALNGTDLHWAAPGHLTVEVFSAIRGRYLGAKITQERAFEAIEALTEIKLTVVATAPLLARMWQLRSSLTAYDAAYVAAAEVNRCALVTADERLARAPDLRCEVYLAT